MYRIAQFFLALALVAGVVLAAGCGMLSGNQAAPTLAPSVGDSYLVCGHVCLEGNAVANATVEAVSVNGNRSLSNVTGADGLYALYLPGGVQFNVTATYQGLQHTIWPVIASSSLYNYDINLTRTPESFIAGTGSISGPMGYNVSWMLAGYRPTVARPDGNGSITTTIRSDNSYSLEVEPGVSYQFNGTDAGIYFSYRNGEGGMRLNVTVGPNETALVDYTIMIP